MTQTRLTKQDLGDEQVPSYIAVEGPIGVGKSTLSHLLGETFDANLILEDAEANPFLPKFYAGEKNAALATQLFFLMQRSQQLSPLQNQDLFHKTVVADFLIDKDQLFAELTLTSDELALYQNVAQQFVFNTAQPDLVIYLQAPVQVLQKRIQKRGLADEKQIDDQYLEQLNEAYSRFFHFYEQAPLIIVNASDLDWVNRVEDYNNLVRFILQHQKGRNYFNPHSNI